MGSWYLIRCPSPSGSESQCLPQQLFSEFCRAVNYSVRASAGPLSCVVGLCFLRAMNPESFHFLRSMVTREVLAKQLPWSLYDSCPLTGMHSTLRGESLVLSSPPTRNPRPSFLRLSTPIGEVLIPPRDSQGQNHE